MNIIPITDLRDTNKIMEMCASNEPIFITKNGYGAMVLMSMKMYEDQQDERILLERLQEIKEGKVVDGRKAMKEILAKYENI